MSLALYVISMLVARLLCVLEQQHSHNSIFGSIESSLRWHPTNHHYHCHHRLLKSHPGAHASWRPTSTSLYSPHSSQQVITWKSLPPTLLMGLVIHTSVPWPTLLLMLLVAMVDAIMIISVVMVRNVLILVVLVVLVSALLFGALLRIAIRMDMDAPRVPLAILLPRIAKTLAAMSVVQTMKMRVKRLLFVPRSWRKSNMVVVDLISN